MVNATISVQDFHDAAARGDAAAVQAGLDQGVKVDAPDDFGNTALMMACARSQTDVCRLLVGAGANPEHKNKYGLGPRNWVRWSDHDNAILKILG